MSYEKFINELISIFHELAYELSAEAFEEHALTLNEELQHCDNIKVIEYLRFFMNEITQARKGANAQ